VIRAAVSILTAVTPPHRPIHLLSKSPTQNPGHRPAPFFRPSGLHQLHFPHDLTICWVAFDNRNLRDLRIAICQTAKQISETEIEMIPNLSHVAVLVSSGTSLNHRKGGSATLPMKVVASLATTAISALEMTRRYHRVRRPKFSKSAITNAQTKTKASTMAVYRMKNSRGRILI
jgi:hypothetical protein